MAQDAKKGFVLYYDYRQHLTLLTNEERGKLLMALLDYGESHSEPDLEGAALMAFSFIRAQMDRDAEKYAETVRKRREAGQKGGRPAKASATDDADEKAKKANGFSEKQEEAKKADTVTDTGTDTGTVTVTDTDTGTDTTPHTPQGDTGTPDGVPAAEPTPYKAIVELYHEICKSYPKLRTVSDQRKKAMAARWKEHKRNIDAFRELFEKAEASPFLKGKNKRNWTADFNWLMDSENMAKVLEGNYDNDKQEGGQKHGERSGHAERHERHEGAGSETALSGFRMADD